MLPKHTAESDDSEKHQELPPSEDDEKEVIKENSEGEAEAIVE